MYLVLACSVVSTMCAAVYSTHKTNSDKVHCACCVAPHSSVSNLYRKCLDNLAKKIFNALPKIEEIVLKLFILLTLKNVALLCIVNFGFIIWQQV